MLLAVMLVVGMIPEESITEVRAADTDTAAFANLGNLGTVNIGSKSESGQWHRIMVGDKEVFCMDLGKACYTGYSYSSSKEEEISSSSTDTATALKARVAYWFDQIKGRSNYAYVYTQTLIWGIEEGQITKTQLTDIISQVRTNTGWYSSSTAKELYDEIFGGTSEVKATIKTWTYSGTSSRKDSIQRLLYIRAAKEEPEYKRLNVKEQYKQKIRFTKYSETRVPLANATFKITALNTKELERFDGYGMTDGADNGADGVSDMTLNTDTNGEISCYFTYNIQSKDYYYYSAEELKDMTADDKKAAKAELDEKGYLYASDLTETGAWDLAEADAIDQKNAASCSYEIEEISANNLNIYDGYFTATSLTGETVNVTGKKAQLTISGDNSWWEYDEGAIEDQFAARLEFMNKYKKVSVNVVKKDNCSADGNAHGDATLDGAEYQLYGNSRCTYPATVYDTDGNTKTAGTYTVSGGRFETDYLQSGKTYYLKEVKAPEGYFLSDEVIEITADATGYTGEFTPNAQTVETHETPKFGNLQVFKVLSDGSTGEAQFEEGSTFDIYLKSKGSYGACDEYERATITIGKDGSGITTNSTGGNLYFGTYKIHQTSTGGHDTEMIDDQEIDIAKDITELNQNGRTYVKLYNNKPFEAYLKIIKVDGNTKKTVLKPNTKYQIFRINNDGSETQVVQSYSNGNKLVDIDTYVTDETGEIMTVKPLKSGTYKIYETDSATGLYIKDSYISLEINSSADNYTTFTDSEGNSHVLITITYINDETKGKLTVEKTGDILTDFTAVENDNLNAGGILDEIEMPMLGETVKNFVYEEEYLKGQVFEIYASEDIFTQDGQGIWFEKDEKVATLTTGEGAKFLDECGGICTYTVDEKTGAVTVTLPLGKYKVVEEKALYGFVLPEKNSWDIEFTWENAQVATVLNSTDATDENGVLKVHNDHAKAAVNLVKKDEQTDKGIAAVFGLYTKDNIYAANGNLLAEAGELLAIVKTDENGKATADIDLPLMSEGYNPETEDNEGLNSGDYYFIEQEISDSYYLDETPVNLHLEYKDGNTKTIEAEAVKDNTQTKVEIDKLKLSNSTELSGAKIEVRDDAGNVIVNYVSGDKGSISLTGKAAELGYSNLAASMDENGNIIIKGLLHDMEYVMVETKPTDGFVTAQNIKFKLVKDTVKETQETIGKTEETEKTVTKVYVYDEAAGEYRESDVNKVQMFDDTTKVEFSKKKITGEDELANCKLQVKKTSGDVIEEWVSTNEKHLIEAKLVAGEEYILAETRPDDGYVTAAEIRFVVMDTGEIQTVTMRDDTTKVEFSKTDITGEKEIPGCRLKVTRKSTGEIIDKWTSTKTKHLIEGKLIIGETYVLTETRPEDGYATAADVEFTVADTGKIQTVTMKDDTIKVEFTKTASDTKKLLGDAKFIVSDSKGNKVYEFTTNGEKAVILEKILAAGETYTFEETEVPEGYKKPEKLKYTVKDTGEIQKIKVVNEKITETPKTGIFINKLPRIICTVLFLAAVLTDTLILMSKRKRRIKVEKEEN